MVHKPKLTALIYHGATAGVNTRMKGLGMATSQREKTAQSSSIPNPQPVHDHGYHQSRKCLCQKGSCPRFSPCCPRLKMVLKCTAEVLSQGPLDPLLVVWYTALDIHVI